MGLFFETRFYPNMMDTRHYIVLANAFGVLDASDKERGWVRAEELLQVFAKKVSPTDLTTNSWVVELVVTTLESETDASPMEVYRLPVH